MSAAAHLPEPRVACENPNTQRAYTQGWNRFVEWCQELGVDAWPVDVESLVQCLGWLADQGFSLSVIARTRAAVAHVCEQAGLPNVSHHWDVQGAWESIRQGSREAPRQAKPITLKLLREMVSRCDDETPAGARDRALLTVGFHSGLRRTPLTALRSEQVQTLHDRIILSVGGGRITLHPEADPDVCAVRAMSLWMKWIEFSGPVWRTIDRHGNVSSDGMTTGRAVSEVVKRRAEAAGMDPEKFTPESLRRGHAILQSEREKAGQKALRQKASRKIERDADGNIGKILDRVRDAMKHADAADLRDVYMHLLAAEEAAKRRMLGL